MDISDVAVNQLVGHGPNGATPVPGDAVNLSTTELETIRGEDITVAIVFHHLKTAWTDLQREGLRSQFNHLDIEVEGVYGAGFDADEQAKILRGLAKKDVDAVVSIPVDTIETADAYRDLVDAGVKLVFMDNVPQGFSHPEDYAGCISSDNEGVGIVAGRFLREFLNGGNVGMITFDAPFYVTNQRETGVRSVLEETPDLSVIAESGFTDPDNVYDITQRIVVQNQDLDGLFVSWADPPAIQAVEAVVDLGVEDIVITTTGLSDSIVDCIAENRLIKGTGAQFPYQQGQIEANMVAQAVLGNETPPYIASGSLAVYRDNLAEQYLVHYREEYPAKQIH